MFKNEAVRLRKKMENAVYQKYVPWQWGNPVDVMAQDWDTLVLLDACRYDTFKELNPFSGKLDAVTSAASKSDEFIAKNFAGRTLHDTVYVSANVYAEDLDDGIFHRVVKTYGNYEERMQGRMPDHVTDVAVEAHESHPNKRLIVHYMQPHVPYIGPKADKLREELHKKHGLRFTGIKNTRGKPAPEIENDDTVGSLLNAASEGYLNSERLRDVYTENLHICLDSVADLIESVDGKTVISADHGELLGDNGRYNHPEGCWIPGLRVVPWMELESETRRTITADPPAGTEYVEDDVVKGHLRDLGYI
jgi:hypothetical protein